GHTQDYNVFSGAEHAVGQPPPTGATGDVADDGPCYDISGLHRGKLEALHQVRACPQTLDSHQGSVSEKSPAGNQPIVTVKKEGLQRGNDACSSGSAANIAGRPFSRIRPLPDHHIK